MPGCASSARLPASEPGSRGAALTMAESAAEVRLRAALHASLQRAPASGPIVIALSGGGDSTALLHVAAHSAQCRERGLRALHVDHRLAQASDAWARHCATLAAGLEVPIDLVSAQVQRAGKGLESAARSARYGALQSRLRQDELLLMAHHADDQAETVLLRLVRGAGVRGLAAMREWRAVPPGWLGRPWLGVPQSLIRQYLDDNRLEWIEDPSNTNLEHDRNHLRHAVMPSLRERWPQAALAMARSAALLASASTVLARVAREWLDSARDPVDGSLDCAALRALDDFALEETVRALVDADGAPSPPARVTARLREDLLAAPADAMPCIDWNGYALRRHRDRLFLTPPLEEVPAGWSALWQGRSELELPAGCGRLSATTELEAPLQVRFRAVGDRFRARHNGPSRSVKTLMQEAGIPTWMRNRTPLLLDQHGIATIGTQLLAERLRSALQEAECEIHWLPATRVGCEPT